MSSGTPPSSCHLNTLQHIGGAWLGLALGVLRLIWLYWLKLCFPSGQKIPSTRTSVGCGGSLRAFGSWGRPYPGLPGGSPQFLPRGFHFFHSEVQHLSFGGASPDGSRSSDLCDDYFWWDLWGDCRTLASSQPRSCSASQKQAESVGVPSPVWRMRRLITKTPARPPACLAALQFIHKHEWEGTKMFFLNAQILIFITVTLFFVSKGWHGLQFNSCR